MGTIQKIATLFGILGVSLLLIIVFAMIFDVKDYFANFMQKHPRIQATYAIVMALGLIDYLIISLL